MAALHSAVYPRPDLSLAPLDSSNMHRRATVGSSSPFAYSNTFEYPRPSSRVGGRAVASDFPYRMRRSTAPSQDQGHNPNNAALLSGVMLSDSASPSPIMHNATLFASGTAAAMHPAPASSSPRSSQSAFGYEHASFAHALHSPPIQPSFSLCPSPEYQSHLNHPRSMQPAPLHSYPSAPALTLRSLAAHGSSSAASAGRLPSSATASSFMLDPTLEPPPDTPPHAAAAAHDPALAGMTREELEAELVRYRRELEVVYMPRLDFASGGAHELDGGAGENKARVHNELGLLGSGGGGGALPGADWVPPPDWERRTAARLKRFCGLNRAGNALCAWHDSRRERRAHPPRMAPENVLNCGCTYKEALFEESLARNDVGSFYPGESVRMDPALRNPLLKLLEKRDGDFERRPDGTWRENEDAHSWEQRGSGSRSGPRRDR